jgi:hypothetical protein
VEPAQTSKRTGAWRRTWPWLVGLAILALIATRVPVDAFRDGVRHGPHLTLAAVNLALYLAVLCTDSVSTWIGLVVLKMRRPFSSVLLVRGATYALFLVNYALGQGGFGYYLHRSGEPALRAAGATLFLIGTNLGMLLVVTIGAWALYREHTDNPAMWWTLVGGCGAFGLYLVVVAISPNILTRRGLLAPLFEAGVRGHLVAMLGRLPHMAVMILGHWAAMRAWGIPVPLWTGLTIMPAIVIASVLPISPAGLGTTQAAFVLFFGSYAVGATEAERTASVLAFAIVHFAYGVLASLAIGLACLPLARRSGLFQQRTSPAPNVDESHTRDRLKP